MKKIVWLAGLLLLLSIVFPNGLPLPKPANSTPAGPTDVAIVEKLSTADAEDKARVVSVYTGLKRVLQRDLNNPDSRRITTTEKWAELQQNTLEVAIDKVGKYPGLDAAIESVFLKTVGTDDVLPGNPDVLAKLITACETIVNSASK